MEAKKYLFVINDAPTETPAILFCLAFDPL